MNKVAIVTGASKGIGKAVGHELLRDGYSVVFTSRNEEELKKAVGEFEGNSKQAFIFPSDISIPDSVSALFAKTVEVFGRLDFLFNNAGISGLPSPLEDLSYEVWNSIINTNLTGSFLCIQEAFRIMKNQLPQGGRIINNGSVSAQTPRPNGIAYTASKHAVTGLTKSASIEGRKYNIACGQIDIGNADTDLLSSLRKKINPDTGQPYFNEPVMSVESVAKMIVHMANLPLEENILFMTMLATKMPFSGRG